MDREKIQQLSGWMGFVSIITIIGGALSAIAGLFALIIGAIPGVISIIMGLKLHQARQFIDAMLSEDHSDSYFENFNLFMANLGLYFKIQGILIIISLVLGVLGVIFGVLGSFYVYQGGYF